MVLMEGFGDGPKAKTLGKKRCLATIHWGSSQPTYLLKKKVDWKKGLDALGGERRGEGAS